MSSKSAGSDSAPESGLFIKLNDTLAGPDLIRQLRELFFVLNHAPSDYTRNLHALLCEASLLHHVNTQTIQQIVDLSKAQGVVILLEDDIEQAKGTAADGVLVNDREKFTHARDKLGDDSEKRIIGLRCALDLERAGQAVGHGADFISFHTGNGSLPDPRIASLWSESSDIPCLIEGPFTNDYVDAYVRAGTTFIDAGDYIWNHPDSVKQATVNILYALEQSLRQLRERPGH